MASCDCDLYSVKLKVIFNILLFQPYFYLSSMNVSLFSLHITMSSANIIIDSTSVDCPFIEQKGLKVLTILLFVFTPCFLQSFKATIQPPLTLYIILLKDGVRNSAATYSRLLFNSRRISSKPTHFPVSIHFNTIITYFYIITNFLLLLPFLMVSSSALCSPRFFSFINSSKQSFHNFIMLLAPSSTLLSLFLLYINNCYLPKCNRSHCMCWIPNAFAKHHLDLMMHLTLLFILFIVLLLPGKSHSQHTLLNLLIALPSPLIYSLSRWHQKRNWCLDSGSMTCYERENYYSLSHI